MLESQQGLFAVLPTLSPLTFTCQHGRHFFWVLEGQRNMSESFIVKRGLELSDKGMYISTMEDEAEIP